MTRKAKAITGRTLDGGGPAAGQPEGSGGNPEKRLGRDNRSAAKGIPRSASGATRDSGQPEGSGGNPEKRLGRDNRSAAKGIPRSANGATRDEGQPAHHCRNFAVAYLNVLIDDADQEELIAALGRIARLSGGERLVEKVELNAPALYRTLCRRGNPELKSVATLLKAMGIRIALQPLREELPNQLARVRRFTRPDEEGAFL